jgi:hypothetical protein
MRSDIDMDQLKETLDAEAAVEKVGNGAADSTAKGRTGQVRATRSFENAMRTAIETSERANMPK